MEGVFEIDARYSDKILNLALYVLQYVKFILNFMSYVYHECDQIMRRLIH